MGTDTFDRLTRLLAGARSRRATLGALLSAVLVNTSFAAVAAKRKGHQKHKRRDGHHDGAGGNAKDRGPGKGKGGHKGKNRGGQKHGSKNRKRSQRDRNADSVQAAATCFPGSPCLVAPQANLTKCDLSGSTLPNVNCKSCNLTDATLKGAVLTGANLNLANLSRTCLVDADLTGANLTGANTSGAIFCRTTMPNGGINNSGCSKGSNCCPTCDAAHPCGSGQVCCGGKCVSGNCCANADCLDPGKPICVNRTCQPCTSNAQCGIGKRCCGGQCKSGTCCTVADCADRSCQSKTCENNQCLYAPLANGTSCNDGNPCTDNDTCQNGQCAGAPKNCSGEADPCNDGVCRQADGACVKRPKQDGTGCNADNDSCTVGDSCQSGVCTPGAGVSCSHLDDQCNIGVCQPDSSCAREPRNDDGLCLAGANFCTDVGVCRDGSCVAGPAVACTASDECHTAGVCDPETGRCSNPTAANGTTCGNNGQCQDGRCVEPCLAVNAVCDPATDTCCDSEGEACIENAACSNAGEGRCCRPEGAFCEQPCDCCGGVCAGGVCCVPGQQCTSSNECCDGQECINDVCTSVCGTDRALCGGGMGTAPCCDGYQCVDGECWPGFCTPTTEECSSTSECCPDGVITCASTSPGGTRCCHPHNQTCRDTDECCGIEVCGPESTCCLGRPFDPDRNTVGFAICDGREHDCCPGLRCHPQSKFCCVDEGQPVPPSSPSGGGFIECCHFAEQGGVCTCHRKGEACSRPSPFNPYLSTCCDGLVCFDGVCNTPCNPFFGPFSIGLPCCIGCTHNENTGICDCP